MRHNIVRGLISGLGPCLVLACALLMGMLSLIETSYDTHLNGYRTTYRVDTCLSVQDADCDPIAIANPDLPRLLKQYFPRDGAVSIVTEVKRVDLIKENSSSRLSLNAIAADNNFIRQFTKSSSVQHDYPSLEVGQVALSQSAVDRYFGEGKGLGMDVEFADGSTATVSYIFMDVPATSHMAFDVITPARDADVTLGASSSALISSTSSVMVYVHVGPYSKTVLDGVLDKVRLHLVENGSLYSSMRYYPIRIDKIHLNRQSGYLKRSGSAAMASVFTISGWSLLIIAIGLIYQANENSFKVGARDAGIRRLLGSSSFAIQKDWLIHKSMIATFLSALTTILFFVVLAFLKNTVGFRPLFELNLNAKVVCLIFLGLFTLFFLASPWVKGLILLERSDGLINFGSNFSNFEIIRTSVLISSLLAFMTVNVSIAVQSGISISESTFRQLSGLENSYIISNKLLTIRQSKFADISGSLDAISSDLQTEFNLLSAKTSTALPASATKQVLLSGVEDPEAQVSAGLVYVDSGFLDLWNLEVVHGKKFSADTRSPQMVSKSRPRVIEIIITKSLAETLDEDISSVVGRQLYANVAGYVIVVGVIEDEKFIVGRGSERKLVFVPIVDQTKVLTIKVDSGGKDISGQIEKALHRYGWQDYEIHYMPKRIRSILRQEINFLRVSSAIALGAIVSFLASLAFFLVGQLLASKRGVALWSALGATNVKILNEFAKPYILSSLIGPLCGAFVYITVMQRLLDDAFKIGRIKVTLIGGLIGAAIFIVSLSVCIIACIAIRRRLGPEVLNDGGYAT